MYFVNWRWPEGQCEFQIHDTLRGAARHVMMLVDLGTCDGIWIVSDVADLVWGER